MTFQFKGRISASKSLLNRAQIIQSYAPELFIDGPSECEDVTHLRRALYQILNGLAGDCGEGGTSFRFLVARATRIPGTHFVAARDSLLRRPHAELAELLSEFGAKISFTPKGANIISNGWVLPEFPLNFASTISSQFSTAILLNAWNLAFDLHFRVAPSMVSQSYWQMTVAVCRQCGMVIEESVPGVFCIPRHQRVTLRHLTIEPDMGSMFAVAAFASLGGTAHFKDWPAFSLQPDFIFAEILMKMGVEKSIPHDGGVEFGAKEHQRLRPVNVNVGQCSDLFPVLAILCAFAEGSSILNGAPHLKHKESNRIDRLSHLLRKLDVAHEILHDGIRIHGNPANRSDKPIEIDVADDHRLAMAAVLARRRFLGLRISGLKSLDKSFPEFLKIIEASCQ